MVAAIALTVGLVLALGGAGGAQLASQHGHAADHAADTEATRSPGSADRSADADQDASDAAPAEILSAVVDSEEPVGPIISPSTTSTTTSTTAPRSSPTTTAPRQSPTTTKQATTTTTAAGEFRSDMEADFLSRINALRAANGLSPLTSHGSLDTRARDWSKHMADNGKLSHSNLSTLFPPWSAAAENVGRGTTVAGLFEALANSPTHRANMLGNYTHVGIGVWRTHDGTIWTTQVFTR
jgi:uncharacterized protein YkwD